MNEQDKDKIATYIEHQYIKKFNNIPRIEYFRSGIIAYLYYGMTYIHLTISKKQNYHINYVNTVFYLDNDLQQFIEISKIKRHYDVDTIVDVYELIDYFMDMLKPKMLM